MLSDAFSPPLQKDKEDLEEISTELELADEDDLVPYVPTKVIDNISDFLSTVVVQLQDR